MHFQIFVILHNYCTNRLTVFRMMVCVCMFWEAIFVLINPYYQLSTSLLNDYAVHVYSNTNLFQQVHECMTDIPCQRSKCFTLVSFYSQDTHYSLIKAMTVMEISTFHEIGTTYYLNDCPLGGE